MPHFDVQGPLQGAPGDDAVTTTWSDLLSGPVEHIARFLPRNEVPCSLRLLHKATAARLRGPQHTTIHLSSPVPHCEYARRWGGPDAVRGLSCAQRVKLVCLTAASGGSVANLEVAVASAGCEFPGGDVQKAAGTAGQLEVCQWLQAHGLLEKKYGLFAFRAAAEAGHRQLCEWFLKNDTWMDFTVVLAAARGGHTGLFKMLLRRLTYPLGRWDLVDIAEGVELEVLQRMHAFWLSACELRGEEPPPEVPMLALAAAAGGPSPDWAAKVEWLEAQQPCPLPRTPLACQRAASRPDALHRLAWLRGRGYPADATALCVAARRGDVACLRYLLAEGVGADDGVAVSAAAAGQLGALRELHAAGCPLRYFRVAAAAAEGGHLAVVSWLAETGLQPMGKPGKRIGRAAAKSGDIELLAWLDQRGCKWGAWAFTAAAEAGNDAALEWLVGRGCPMPASGRPYMQAINNHDMRTLRCLRRLGCPWGPRKLVYNRAVAQGWISVLSWLLEEKCPIL